MRDARGVIVAVGARVATRVGTRVTAGVIVAVGARVATRVRVAVGAGREGVATGAGEDVCVAVATEVCVEPTPTGVVGRTVAGAMDVDVAADGAAPVSVGLAGDAGTTLVVVPAGVDWLIGAGVARLLPVARVVGRGVTVGRAVGPVVIAATGWIPPLPVAVTRPPLSLVAVTRPPLSLVAVTRPPLSLVAVAAALVGKGALALSRAPWEPKTRVATRMAAISATATPRAPSSAGRVVRAGVGPCSSGERLDTIILHNTVPRRHTAGASAVEVG